MGRCKKYTDEFKQFQLGFTNGREVLREAALDIQEGANMIVTYFANDAVTWM